MESCTHILAAIELHEDGERVLARARRLADACGAELSVLHVVEYLPLDPAGDLISTLPADTSAERAAQARAQLEAWCASAHVPPNHLHIVLGSITTEILHQAQEIKADLIVVGHYSRRGLSALFSHTEEGVVHKAKCDVLVVHLGA